MAKRFTAKQKHLEELRCVFGLGGGELRDKLWGGLHWYDGAPEYAAKDCEALAADMIGNRWPELRTALEDRIYVPPEGFSAPTRMGRSHVLPDVRRDSLLVVRQRMRAVRPQGMWWSQSRMRQMQALRRRRNCLHRRWMVRGRVRQEGCTGILNHLTIVVIP